MKFPILTALVIAPVGLQPGFVRADLGAGVFVGGCWSYRSAGWFKLTDERDDPPIGEVAGPGPPAGARLVIVAECRSGGTEQGGQHDRRVVAARVPHEATTDAMAMVEAILTTDGEQPAFRHQLRSRMARSSSSTLPSRSPGPSVTFNPGPV
jgi:hypothetical protein